MEFHTAGITAIVAAAKREERAKLIELREYAQTLFEHERADGLAVIFGCSDLSVAKPPPLEELERGYVDECDWTDTGRDQEKRDIDARIEGVARVLNAMIAKIDEMVEKET